MASNTLVVAAKVVAPCLPVLHCDTSTPGAVPDRFCKDPFHRRPPSVPSLNPTRQSSTSSTSPSRRPSLRALGTASKMVRYLFQPLIRVNLFHLGGYLRNRSRRTRFLYTNTKLVSRSSRARRRPAACTFSPFLEQQFLPPKPLLL